MLSYGLPAPGRRRGGIERVAHELADGLGRRGHYVVVHTHDPAPAAAHYTTELLPWRRFVGTWIGRRLTMGYLGNVLMLLPRLDGFDAVVAHGDSLLLPFRQTPLVRIVHGSAWREATSATSAGRAILQAGVYLQELLSAAVHRYPVGVSNGTRRANPFVRRVIPNGVNRRTFRPDAHQRANHPQLVFVGALSGRKRGAWLLDLFSTRIRPRLPDVELHMVTPPGPQWPGVTYHQGISDIELADLYRRSWLYVSPSSYEGFGLPYVEAMACGTPVLATANPGSREILAAGGGVLCDDTTFGEELMALLEDHDRRRTLASQALQVAERYDLERTIDAYEELLIAIADAATS